MITEPESDVIELESIYNKMIHDMADDLTTDYHGQSWVINYYFQKAKQKLEGGKQIMKVMISQPMNGIPDSEVRRIQNELKERFAKYHIEVIDSYIEDDVESDVNNPGVFYLGKTLMDSLSKVDAVYFVDGWQRARGCKIERQICEEYGIMILDDSFFKQENEVHIKRQFGMDKIQIMPCKNENQKYEVEMWSGTTPDTYNHIPRIDGMEEE